MKALENFNAFIDTIQKPLSFVFHTVLPDPDDAVKANVQHILNRADSIIVMTHNASDILVRDYIVDHKKIAVIPHGTHLVAHTNIDALKHKYGFEGRNSTFYFRAVKLRKKY